MIPVNEFNIKPQILLPLNPETYYGSSISIENLHIDSKIYVGVANRVEEYIVNSITKDSDSYYIDTDSIVFVAYPNTRIQYSTNYKR